MFGLFKFNEDIKTEFSFVENTIVLNQTGPQKNNESFIILNTLSYLVHFLAIYKDSKDIITATKDLISRNINEDFSITRTPELINYNQSNLSVFFELIDPYLSPLQRKAVVHTTQLKMWSMDMEYYSKMMDQNSFSKEKNIAKYTFKLKIKPSGFVIYLNPILKLSTIFLPLSLIALIDDTYFKIPAETKTLFKEALSEILNNHDYISLSERTQILESIALKYFKENTIL